MNEPKDYSYDELLRFSRALLAENTALRVDLKQMQLKEREDVPHGTQEELK